MTLTRPGARHADRAPVRSRLRTPLLYAVSFAVALALAAALVTVGGHSMADALLALYQGSLDGGASIGQTIDETTPLLIVAIGAIVSARAGIFNIGQEGQLIVGAAAGAAIGLFVPGPGWLVGALALLGAALAGALWAGIPAVLYYWRGVDVVVATLLMVFVAMQLVSFAVNRDYLLQETAVEGQILSPQSDLLPEGVRLPRLGEYPDFNLGTGFVIALAVTGVVAYLLRHGKWGFRLRMLGLNPVAARRAGVRAAALGGGALLLSGGAAGLAGGVMLTGGVYRIQAGFADNVGWEGLLVALVARNHPLVAIPVALFFGVLRAGGGFLASTGVPRYLVSVVTALLVLAAAFPAAYAELRKRRRPAVEA
ncbi:simple sugar transport system permease protein [Sinosporangium album]|uniref:Simple sugar transport system permease protein n=1 Tax=Sinosporangium album TaxID=504805 RepID=A0A1G7U010_9ACTN|nr:ABC transporter permease [Sinosporangium album]SDG40671.1 simple sugar transport system permease protein [Sinosporangium album]